MTDQNDLHVEVQGDYITISLPGTKFMVTYYKVDESAAADGEVRLDG